MTSDKTWIVVVHQEGARVFSHNRAGSGMKLISKIEHPEGRLHGRDRVSDRPGRLYRPTDQNRQGLSSPLDPDEKDAIDFARRVVDLIAQGRATLCFENLILVAGPNFLGLIRGMLDRSTAERVVGSVCKNLAQLSASELAVELADQLADADRAAALSA
jgi:protein required for attachment to host cells